MMRDYKKPLLLTALLFGLWALAPMHAAQATAEKDPLEGYNRAMFAFNEGVDTVLLRPIARGYRYIMPERGRQGLRNAFRNLGEPVNALNALLQGDVNHFFTASWRFVLNTTVGLGGLYDFAGEYGGLPHRSEDFGQTLAVWTGESDSTYFVLPLLGPSNLRDALGRVGDVFSSPWYYALNNEESLALVAGEAVVDREALLDITDDLYNTSFDPYSSFKSAYEQRRNAQISNRYKQGK